MPVLRELTGNWSSSLDTWRLQSEALSQAFGIDFAKYQASPCRLQADTVSPSVSPITSARRSDVSPPRSARSGGGAVSARGDGGGAGSARGGGGGAASASANGKKSPLPSARGGKKSPPPSARGGEKTAAAAAPTPRRGITYTRDVNAERRTFLEHAWNLLSLRCCGRFAGPTHRRLHAQR